MVDLPTNPLSFLVLTLLAEQPVAQATALYRHLTNFWSAIDNVRVTHRGESIIQGSLIDLAVLNAALHGYTPHGTHLTGAAANVAMSFILALGRKPFWHEEGFPATSRGNLRFGFNVLDTTPGTATALQWALEAVELIEDTPTQYLKYTTNSRALTATGRQRVPLPMGNEILGVLLFDPSTEISTTETFAWGKIKVMKDNVEQYYVESNWESLRADLARRILRMHIAWGHLHGQAAVDTETGHEQIRGNEPPLQYGYLDFDPLDDGSYSLETAGASDLELDLSSDVSTGTARYMPIELVKLAGR